LPSVEQSNRVGLGLLPRQAQKQIGRKSGHSSHYGAHDRISGDFELVSFEVHALSLAGPTHRRVNTYHSRR
jgi:hypothetical protein